MEMSKAMEITFLAWPLHASVHVPPPPSRRPLRPPPPSPPSLAYLLSRLHWSNCFFLLYNSEPLHHMVNLLTNLPHLDVGSGLLILCPSKSYWLYISFSWAAAVGSPNGGSGSSGFFTEVCVAGARPDLLLLLPARPDKGFTFVGCLGGMITTDSHDLTNAYKCKWHSNNWQTCLPEALDDRHCKLTSSGANSGRRTRKVCFFSLRSFSWSLQASFPSVPSGSQQINRRSWPTCQRLAIQEQKGAPTAFPRARGTSTEVTTATLRTWKATKLPGATTTRTTESARAASGETEN